MSDFAANVIGITIFVLVIAFSIAFHEWGHFVTARRYGVKVTEFMVGFGPKIWSKTRGETDYGLKAIPVGGYVRIIGMIPPPKGAPAGMVPASTTGRFATMIEQAQRRLHGGDRSAGCRPGLLQAAAPQADRRHDGRTGHEPRSWPRRCSPSCWSVSARRRRHTTVREIVPCVPTAAEPFGQAGADGSCAPRVRAEPSHRRRHPARRRRRRPGRRPVTTWDDITEGLADFAARREPSRLGLQRPGTAVRHAVTLAEAIFPVFDEAGEPTGETQSLAFVGVRPDAAYVPMSIDGGPRVHVGPHGALGGGAGLAAGTHRGADRHPGDRRRARSRTARSAWWASRASAARSLPWMNRSRPRLRRSWAWRRR